MASLDFQGIEGVGWEFGMGMGMALGIGWGVGMELSRALAFIAGIEWPSECYLKSNVGLAGVSLHYTSAAPWMP